MKTLKKDLYNEMFEVSNKYVNLTKKNQITGKGK